MAFPLTLLMAWAKTPPYFCAVTESVADLANALPKNMSLPKVPQTPSLESHLLAVMPQVIRPLTKTCGFARHLCWETALRRRRSQRNIGITVGDAGQLPRSSRGYQCTAYKLKDQTGWRA